MKRHLLLGSALLATLSAFPQNTVVTRRVEPVNMTERIALKFAPVVERTNALPGQAAAPMIQQAEAPATNLRTANTTALYTSWTNFTGSMNIYGVTNSSSMPLQYNDELNTVTFVHRKSATYAPNPAPAVTGAITGVLVTMVSQNFGATWDTTCVWNDNNNWARYPQGGILNPANNTSIASASMVASGPITQANPNLGWIGSAFAAKKLGPGTYNNVAASQTFIANSTPFAGLGAKLDYPTYNFTSTDDGKVRSLGLFCNGDINSLTIIGQDYQGARLVTSDMTGGVLTWSETLIAPSVRVGVTGNLLVGQPSMAWSEDGQTGYVVHIGSDATIPQNSVGVNSGLQPIVHKTNDGGNSWQLVSGIDFSSPTFTSILNQIPSTHSNSLVTIPCFNTSEGISTVVDRNNKLHLVSMILPSFSTDPDSSAFFSSFLNYDGERYNYLHLPGARPYLYDFTTDGSPNGWTVTLIDSLASEGPSTVLGRDGYATNPWDGTGGTSGTDKVNVDCRIQASRTPDGHDIIYTWAETDTALTFNGSVYLKWNKFPNVKARLMEIDAVGGTTLSATEINVSRLPYGPNNLPNPNVNNRAFNHFISPRCAINATANTVCTRAINLPITISNCPTAAFEQQNPVNHWYATAGLVFTVCTLPDAIAENSSSIFNSVIYPNPAKTNATLAIDLKNNAKVDISVINLVGQTVKSVKAEGQAGSNTINIDLNGLSKGIYLVNIKAGTASSTKKLVVD